MVRLSVLTWRTVVVIVLAVVAVLQFSLWLGDYGVINLVRMDRQVAEQREQNDVLRERNRLLQAEVIDLKRGTEALEERARSRLGMIKEDEVFYQIVTPEQSATP